MCSQVSGPLMVCGGVLVCARLLWCVCTCEVGVLGMCVCTCVQCVPGCERVGVVSTGPAQLPAWGLPQDLRPRGVSQDWSLVPWPPRTMLSKPCPRGTLEMRSPILLREGVSGCPSARADPSSQSPPARAAAPSSLSWKVLGCSRSSEGPLLFLLLPLPTGELGTTHCHEKP